LAQPRFENNAYVILDDGPQFKDGFFIVLANAALIQNGNNGAAVKPP
jgi:hypothetical protein